MDDIKSPSAVTIRELSRIVKEFEEKIQNGTEDPDRFLTLTEINWRYQCFIFGYASVIDPKYRRTGIGPSKKREFQARGIKLRTNRRAERSILTLHGKLVYSRNILIPENQGSKEALFDLLQTKKVVPLDDALGISNLPFKMTPALMLRCAYWAQNQCSYQAAEDVMRNTYSLDINDILSTDWICIITKQKTFCFYIKFCTLQQILAVCSIIQSVWLQTI